MDCFAPESWPSPPNARDAWEVLDPVLNNVLGWGRTAADIARDVRRGPMGLDGLMGLVERFVREYGLSGGLLEGKFRVLFEAISIA